MMPRFETYTVVACGLLIGSLMFVNANNLIVAIGLSIISLIPATLLKKELGNAKWVISFWSKLLPMGLSIFIFLAFVYMTFTDLTKLIGNFNLSNSITLLIFIFDAFVGFFLVYTYIFSRPGAPQNA